MMMPVTITTKMLLQHDACPEQVKKFRRRWGKALTVSSETEAVAICERVATAFGFAWAAKKLLSSAGFTEWNEAYIAAQKEQLENNVRAHAKYAEIFNAAYYRQDAMGSAWFREVRDAALADRNKAFKSAAVEWHRAIAVAFGREFYRQENRE